MSSSNSQNPGLDGSGADTQTVQPTQVEVVSKQDYLNLQGEYTRSRQGLIEASAKLVEKEPQMLSQITDKKLQDSVVKQLYGHDSYETFVALEGAPHKGATDDNDEDDESTQLVVAQKKLREIEYKLGKKEIDDAIEKYRAQNPAFFREESSLSALKEKLSLISSAVSVDERVKMAATVAFGSPVDPTSLAYKSLNVSPSAGTPAKAPSDGGNKDKNTELLRAMLKLPTK